MARRGTEGVGEGRIGVGGGGEWGTRRKTGKIGKYRESEGRQGESKKMGREG